MIWYLSLGPFFSLCVYMVFCQKVSAYISLLVKKDFTGTIYGILPVSIGLTELSLILSL